MKKRTLVLLLPALFFFLIFTAASPFPGKKTTVTVGFYNVENLFDLEDDPNKNDQEFLPGASYGWCQEHLDTKLENLATVISEMGDEDGPEILGLAEVENKAVVEMLCAHPLLKKHKYEVVHVESPDQRGIDCALMYKKKDFLPLYHKTYSVDMSDVNPDITTRDILLVKGLIGKEREVTLVVNHWSSRRGGAEKSEWKRERAATVLRHVLDSIQELDPQANVIIMGDFNDEPQNKSIRGVLKSGKDAQEANHTGLFNTFAKLKLDGNGTLKYRGRWDLFDQIMVTFPMTRPEALLHYVDCSASIYNPKWMRVEKEGDWIDAPKRSHIRKQFYPDGYSDHFPVYIHLEY